MEFESHQHSILVITVVLDFLTSLDMYLFIERGMRSGISMASKRYVKANNPRAADYDPSKPNKFITYLDANSLYGWGMSFPLPKGGFKWKQVMPTKEQIVKLKEKSKIGWIFEVDLEYLKRNSTNLTTGTH